MFLHVRCLSKPVIVNYLQVHTPYSLASSQIIVAKACCASDVQTKIPHVLSLLRQSPIVTCR